LINVDGAVLRGRRREQEKLDQLLRDVHGGRSRVLVLRGEAGAGKTALLDYLGGAGGAGRVIRTAGVELETEIDYSGLQQLCAPYLSALGAAVHAGGLGFVEQEARTEKRVPGLYPGRLSYGSVASFPDPDGNGFLLQEASERFPE